MALLRFTLLLSLVLFSCKKEIDIKLKDADPRMVIVANLNTTEGQLTVQVSQSGSYFTPYSETKINNATVTFYAPNQMPVVVPNVGDGQYALPFTTAQVGENYRIVVTYDGVDYEANSMLMGPLVGTSINAADFPPGQVGGPNYIIIYRFQDQTGVGNAYKSVEILNGERLDKVNEISIGKDNQQDGQIITINKIGFYDAGDTVSFEIQSINQQTYNYYNELRMGTDPNSAAQGNPNYVWTNRALGYFSVYSTSTLTVVLN